MTARALTIAGSDPTGGAGIQQDLKTFHALGAWGLSAITAVTIQDTNGVEAWHPVPFGAVCSQIAAVVRDIGVDAVKTGMVPNRETIVMIAETLDRHNIHRIVVDPVFISTSGDALTDDDTVGAVRDLLVARALVVTPNASEAERLTGIAVTDRASQIEAARALRGLGARAAVVTGGHLEGARALDVLVDEDGSVHSLDAGWVDVKDVHGTGCMFSAAITARLAHGDGVLDATRKAKAVVTAAIASARKLGGGAYLLEPTLQ